METPDLVQFIKDTKGSHPWTVSSVIRVAVTLYLKVQLFSNLSKEQKNLLVCNLVKKALEEEKAELDKKVGLSEDKKKIETAVFEKILVAVDEVLPSVLEHIPVPELPKAVTRWFSFIPCSAISVGLHASEQLVSLANLKKVEAVLEKVSEVAPVAAVVAEVSAVAVEVQIQQQQPQVQEAAAETQTVVETKTEKQNEEDKA
jgi:hypothetical protein